METSENGIQVVVRLSSYEYSEIKDYGILVGQDSSLLEDVQIYIPQQENSRILHEGRSLDHQQLFYNFSSTAGNMIYDRSETGSPVDLAIDPVFNTLWSSVQGLKIHDNTLIYSDTVLSAFRDSLLATNEISVECWIKPDRIDQAGPANIIAISSGSGQRLFSLGQEGNVASYDFHVRMTTSDTDENGLPDLKTSDQFFLQESMHIVYTRDNAGSENIYVNGLVKSGNTRSGEFTGWDANCRLELGNFLSMDRPWNGTFYLAALYNTALDASQVEMNYMAGIGELVFTIDLEDLYANTSYYIRPFVRTDQGLFYGDVEEISIDNSISPFNKDSVQIEIYPNPSQGDFIMYIGDDAFSGSSAILRIFDLSNKLVFSEEIDLSNIILPAQIPLKLSGILRSGIYLVMLKSGSDMAYRKLIIP